MKVPLSRSQILNCNRGSQWAKPLSIDNCRSQEKPLQLLETEIEFLIVIEVVNERSLSLLITVRYSNSRVRGAKCSSLDLWRCIALITTWSSSAGCSTAWHSCLYLMFQKEWTISRNTHLMVLNLSSITLIQPTSQDRIAESSAQQVRMVSFHQWRCAGSHQCSHLNCGTFMRSQLVMNPEPTIYVRHGTTPSVHLLDVHIPAYGVPLTIFERIRMMFVLPFFRMPVDSLSRRGYIEPQHSSSRGFTTSVQISVMAANHLRLPWRE